MQQRKGKNEEKYWGKAATRKNWTCEKYYSKYIQFNHAISNSQGERKIVWNSGASKWLGQCYYENNYFFIINTQLLK